MQVIKEDNRTRYHLTQEEADTLSVALSHLSQSKQVEKLIAKDQGSCIRGNGVWAFVIPPRCKNPRVVRLFTQPWTQGEQSKALKKLIQLVGKKYPKFKDAIKYDSGSMD